MLAQTPCQIYWKELLKHVEEGKLHPDMVRAYACMPPCATIIASVGKTALEKLLVSVPLCPLNVGTAESD